MKIGVLALQGAFIEHIQVLEGLGVEAVAVRLPQELEGLCGLIIPGGESTTIGKLMDQFKLRAPLSALARDSFPVFGTCAGMILLSRKVPTLPLSPLEAIDLEIRRNAFGRQVDSFQTDLAIPALGPEPFHAIFIRAPYIEKAGPGVEILARLPEGPIVAARQRNILVASFHPELTSDTRFHRFFLGMVR
ncbi:MAG: pyridoxal 5'-phosphate synthase glutaminase subunit PdxT [Chloroflexi bacterium]|nr:pyridoxal 5'-phosphate synthase glutaminase subunit PdxT [Chloroflexota bacterium]